MSYIFSCSEGSRCIFFFTFSSHLTSPCYALTYNWYNLWSNQYSHFCDKMASCVQTKFSEHLYQHSNNQIAWLLFITSREHITEIKRDLHIQVESASQGIAIVTSLCETYSVWFLASRDPFSLVYLDALHLHLSVKPPSASTPCNPFQVPM